MREARKVSRFVFRRLRERSLYVKLSKYEIWLDILTFLSHIVSIDGIFVYPRKTEAMLD